MNHEPSAFGARRKGKCVLVRTFVERSVEAPKDLDLRISRARALLVAWLIREDDRRLEKGAA